MRSPYVSLALLTLALSSVNASAQSFGGLNDCVHFTEDTAKELAKTLKERKSILRVDYTTPERAYEIRKIRKIEVRAYNSNIRTYNVILNGDYVLSADTDYVARHPGATLGQFDSLRSTTMRYCERKGPKEVLTFELEEHATNYPRVFANGEVEKALNECRQDVLNNIELFTRETISYTKKFDTRGYFYTQQDRNASHAYQPLSAEKSAYEEVFNASLPFFLLSDPKTMAKGEARFSLISIVGASEKEVGAEPAVEAAYDELGNVIRPAKPALPGRKVKEYRVEVLGPASGSFFPTPRLIFANASTGRQILDVFRVVGPEGLPHRGFRTCEKTIVVEPTGNGELK